MDRAGAYSADAPGSGFWAGRRVLVTGHTGFKGGWLSLWLSRRGASVFGFALDPPTTPSLFESASVSQVLQQDVRADVRDRDAFTKAVIAARPDVVFHLAAQPSVREAYQDPIGTIATNVIGTAHLLDAVRQAPSVKAVVVVTTDKVYENQERPEAYRETDVLGGHDPYSASKASAEIVAASFRRSFFNTADSALVATARAGNVIGGGDWTADRLVPDCFRAFAAGKPLFLRYPGAVRPWQHVLESLSGYLLLAERLVLSGDRGLAKAWNFGPDQSGDATVGDVAAKVHAIWGAATQVVHDTAPHPHEAGLLRLDSAQARTELGWKPRWSLQQSLEATVAWHRVWLEGRGAMEMSFQQIDDYERS